MAKFSSKFAMDEVSIKTEPKNEKKSKYCSKCGYENLVTSKFCADCGNDKFYDTLDQYNDVKNSKYCANCKTKLSINTKFCPNCGKNNFVKSLGEVEELELDNIHSFWQTQIKEQKKILDDLNAQIRSLEYTKRETNKELDNIYKEYDKETDKLNGDYLNSQADYSNRSKMLEKEYDDLSMKEKSLSNKIKEVYEKIERDEVRFKKDITALTNDINRLKTENEKLLKEIDAVKKTNSFVLKKHDKDHVYIGRYDGKELLWKVINETTTEMLLITHECIDASSKESRSLYETADRVLEKIYKEAFSDEEKAYIVGDISLLSHTQLINYMYYKEKRICGYNKLAGSKANLRNGLISWWLKEDEIVNGKGDLNTTVSTASCHGIRPVITVKKKK